MPENIVQYYPNASWAVVNGAFTSKELREIADKIDDPKKRVEDGNTK